MTADPSNLNRLIPAEGRPGSRPQRPSSFRRSQGGAHAKTLPLCSARPRLGARRPPRTSPSSSIYTYESFTSEWGPGPTIETAFEETCDCDGPLRRRRRRRRAARPPPPRRRAARPPTSCSASTPTSPPRRPATGLFAPHGIAAPDLDLPVAWDDPDFLPYDWGYFAFVYDGAKMTDPPASFEELIASDHSIVIHDPRSSTPGLGLLLWIKTAYGDRAAGDSEGAAPPHRHRHPRLVRGLRPVHQRRGRHGARLHHLARLPPDRRGGRHASAPRSSTRATTCRSRSPA